eukprot:13974-Heterococcus_DN1.PRE.3
MHAETCTLRTGMRRIVSVSVQKRSRLLCYTMSTACTTSSATEEYFAARRDQAQWAYLKNWYHACSILHCSVCSCSSVLYCCQRHCKHAQNIEL